MPHASAATLVLFSLFAFVGGVSADVRTFDAELVDPSRRSVGVDGLPDDEGRVILLRIRYDDAAAGPAPLILISHGGTGSVNGHTRGEHLGIAFAERGFVAVSVSHRESVPRGLHQADRPADVSIVIDAFDRGDVVLPSGAPVVDLDRIGHAGHSYGAYTSHALGGARFEPSGGAGVQRTDPRVDAIVPISPQGADQFGFYDRGPSDNSWQTVSVPVCAFVGGAEADTNVRGTIAREGWRLEGHTRYTPEHDRLLFVLAGQSHSDMWSTGSDEVEAFVAETAASFFDLTLRGLGTIGQIGREGAGVSRSVRSTDFNGDGSRDFFDVASHLVALEESDPDAEMTSDRPVDLTVEDARAFVRALGRER